MPEKSLFLDQENNIFKLLPFTAIFNKRRRQGEFPVNLSKRTIALAAVFCVLFCGGQGAGSLYAAEPEQENQKKSMQRSGTDIGSTVLFSARDSVIYRFDRKSMELHGKARLERDSTTVTAPKITVDFGSSTLEAFGEPSGTSGKSVPAFFSDREGSYNSDKISYTFDSGTGETTNVKSQMSGVYFTGKQVSRLENGELVIKDGAFTTCDEDEPHYWIESENMRIIPGDRIIAHPFIMYIRPELFSKRLPAIPVLPFPYLVFPLLEHRKSGILLPRPGYDKDRGFHLSKLGYFWAIDDYMDLRMDGDIAFNGSWRLGERFRYKSRDRFSGVLEGEYERYFKGDPEDPDYEKHSSWNLHVEHHQDFSLSSLLDLNVRFQGGDRDYDLSSIDNETIINEQVQSYASYGKTFDDENSILTVGFQYIDDLRSSNFNLLGGVEFYQNRFYPFRRGRLGTLGDWRDRFSITSGAALRALLSSYDSKTISEFLADANFQFGYFKEFSEKHRALVTQGFSFQGLLLDDESYGSQRYGMRFQFPLRLQSTLLRHFNVNAGIYFNHYLVGNDLLHQWDGTSVVTTERNDWKGFSTWGFSADVSTRLYASMQTPFLERFFGIKALRHTLVPTVSYTWNPDFTDTDYNRYLTVYDGTGYLRYNRFEHSVYSDVPGGQSTVGLTLKNLFHGKIDEGVDGERTVHLLSLTASTSYNFAADEFRWSPLLITASSTALLPNFLFSAGALYDFYSYDSESGERVNRFNAEDRNGLLRFLSGYVNMSLNLEGKRKNGNPGRPEALRAEQAIFHERFNIGDFMDVDYSLPWRLRLSFYMQSDRLNPLEEARISTLLNVSAKLALSRNWQAGINTGYDISNGKFVFPMLQLYRDLHCWQVGFQWVPSGEYNSYYLQIGLKAPGFKDVRFKTGWNTRHWTR